MKTFHRILVAFVRWCTRQGYPTTDTEAEDLCAELPSAAPRCRPADRRGSAQQEPERGSCSERKHCQGSTEEDE